MRKAAAYKPALMCCITLLLLCLTLLVPRYACAETSVEEQVPEEEYLTVETVIIKPDGTVVTLHAPQAPYSEQLLTSSLCDVTTALLHAARKPHAWVNRYVSSRMEPVNLVLREAWAFGPWYADWDPTITEARADGGLTEWDTRYYVTHFWSGYGQAILELQPHDLVTTNDVTVRIEGVFDYPKDSTENEILFLTGDDATIYQTCVPDSDYNRIAYGH